MLCNFFQSVGQVSVRPNLLSFYSVAVERQRSSRQAIQSMYNLQQRKYSGQIKQQHRKKVRQAVEWLIAAAERKRVYSKDTGKYFYFRVNFVTLTLSSTQVHCDKTIKRECFDKFLQALRNSFKGILYVWRCEPQKNGNIHFHLTTNKYIPYDWLRNVWNRMQNRLGYVDRFAALHGHDNPNSTDVHSIRSVKNIAAYISKYCTKDNGYRVICGKVYGMSDKLTAAAKLTFTEDTREYKELRSLAVAGGQVGVRHDFCTLFPFSWHSLLIRHDNYSGEAYRKHLREICTR